MALGLDTGLLTGCALAAAAAERLLWTSQARSAWRRLRQRCAAWSPAKSSAVQCSQLVTMWDKALCLEQAAVQERGCFMNSSRQAQLSH